MAQVVFSSWGRNIVDNRAGGAGTEAQFRLPVTYDGERPMAAFMGWDGIIVFNKDVDVPVMAAEYMRRVQTLYCCGKCTPGKKGTRVLMDALAAIIAGKASEADLATIEDLADLLKNCKCTLCQSSTVPVLDAVKYFRNDFLAYINSAKKPAAEFSYIDKYTAPCQDKCPAHIDIPAYIEGIKDYHFGHSLAAIRDNMPLPSVCGRVCPHPCETACRRKNVDEPISIMVLKRSASDYEWQHKIEPPMQPKPRKSKTVAVVGAGPAGLAAAYYLALEGYPVTIYEALPEGFGGGMVAVGIPPYRQPRHLLQRDIDIISAMGVEIIYNTRIGKDISLAELKSKYNAVFLAPGAHRSKPMGVEGEDKGYKGFLKGGIDFLREAYMGKPTGMGKKVVVVGGGNTAIDCVRVALREGAEESILLYRRSRKEMPADVWEVDGADEEGVKFEFQVLPTRIIVDANDRITGVECVRMALGEPDASGRRRPEPMAGSEFVVECDTVIPAIGQDPDLGFIPPDLGIDITKWNTIVTKYIPYKDAAGKELKDGMGNSQSRTLITDCNGIFAGGDAEIGPLTAVACIGSGHRAAKVIQRWLEEGKAYLTDDEYMEDILNYMGVYDKTESVPWLDSAARAHQAEVHGKERASYKNYCEVELGFTNSQAVREAERCLRCYRVAMVAV
ncbi:dihydropyrimidine dehydrogenase subunit A [Geotalea uraniireducens]|uniref:NADPH-Fe(3+) oxidoreductase subunit beta n=1 Tax=Geotalea uraniireducens (strain Rf4) TaxID=351605 RepID=A5G7M5_GEOUR|nr:dihydropyrimidine dehydrogenase subunit A [Geotalea uraniireducens]ABQ27793.1 FAD-dependent pyridine nucleotide-disulfide oxidoreductase [Geotalea uraniireducens Rf4]